MTSKIDYSRLPRIAGSSLNHMIRNCLTTSQETFNDGYNTLEPRLPFPDLVGGSFPGPDSHYSKSLSGTY